MKYIQYLHWYRAGTWRSPLHWSTDIIAKQEIEEEKSIQRRPSVCVASLMARVWAEQIDMEEKGR